MMVNDNNNGCVDSAVYTLAHADLCGSTFLSLGGAKRSIITGINLCADSKVYWTCKGSWLSADKERF